MHSPYQWDVFILRKEALMLDLLRAVIRGWYLKYQCRIIGHIWIRARVPASASKPSASKTIDVVTLYQDVCIICGGVAAE